MSRRPAAAPAAGWRGRLLPLLFWLLVWECAALCAAHRTLLPAWALWRETGDPSELLACLWAGQTFILPAPPRVAEEFFALAGTGEFCA